MNYQPISHKDTTEVADRNLAEAFISVQEEIAGHIRPVMFDTDATDEFGNSYVTQGEA